MNWKRILLKTIDFILLLTGGILAGLLLKV